MVQPVQAFGGMIDARKPSQDYSQHLSTTRQPRRNNNQKCVHIPHSNLHKSNETSAQ
jgi:hypothetical protein